MKWCIVVSTHAKNVRELTAYSCTVNHIFVWAGYDAVKMQFIENVL